MHSPNLYRWLQECQLDPEHEYYPGWRESREFLIELAENYHSFDFSITGPIVLCGFLEMIGDNQPWLLTDLPKQLIYGPVSDDALKFTGAVQNRHILFGLFRILKFNERVAT